MKHLRPNVEQTGQETRQSKCSNGWSTLLLTLMDKAHNDIYPFDMTHIQKMTLDLIQELISLKFIR